MIYGMEYLNSYETNSKEILLSTDLQMFTTSISTIKSTNAEYKSTNTEDANDITKV